MNFFRTNFLPLFTVASLTVGAVAQDLNATVTQDPTAGTATYGFSIQGPPNGLAVPVLSLRQGTPMLFPGLFGSLDIDPLFLISLPLIPLPLSGFGQGQIQVPLPLANNLPLMFQAAVIDPAHGNQVAFANFAAANPVLIPANPALPAVMLQTAYNARTCCLTVTFAAGPGGANVMILVNGGQKAQGFLILNGAGAGTVSVPIPGCMQRGDTVTVLVNNVPVSTYTH